MPPRRRWSVLLTKAAARDLEEIHDYIAETDGYAKAHHVLDKLAATLADLAHLPERGAHPRELLELGLDAYRQVLFKPYRLIDHIADTAVIVYLIADGRRDMQSLLLKRLLRG